VDAVAHTAVEAEAVLTAPASAKIEGAGAPSQVPKSMLP
jgi:hypothetical protein